jgi:hypothetical protein
MVKLEVRDPISLDLSVSSNGLGLWARLSVDLRKVKNFGL